MVLRKILKIVSFGLLFYLLANSFMNFDFAASKNNAFTTMQKMEIDSIQSIVTVKQKAKEHAAEFDIHHIVPLYEKLYERFVPVNA